MKNVLFFEAMLTPKIIVLLYWISLVSIITAGVFSIIGGALISGVLGVLAGGVLTRVLYEMIIVSFKNNEYLRKISERE